MLCTAETFREMTQATMALADEVCGGRVVMMHEGGYSEVHVPFCGHATIATLAGSKIDAPDPFAATLAQRQPGPAFEGWVEGLLADMAVAL